MVPRSLCGVSQESQDSAQFEDSQYCFRQNCRSSDNHIFLFNYEVRTFQTPISIAIVIIGYSLVCIEKLPADYNQEKITRSVLYRIRCDM